MREFIDSNGKTWKIRATVANWKKLQEEEGVDLFAVFRDSARLWDFLNDSPLLIRAGIQHISEPESEAFVNAIGAEELDQLRDVIFEEGLALTYRSRIREGARKAIEEDFEKIQSLITKATET
jgi:hypothetical protein